MAAEPLVEVRFLSIRPHALELPSGRHGSVGGMGARMSTQRSYADSPISSRMYRRAPLAAPIALPGTDRLAASQARSKGHGQTLRAAT
ncbi:hypothetical protein ACSCB1_15725 [Streptomyces europaeiscabiei]|uniref:hypothetical protein n=3 Tax=Streptomyces europaeiscabiei TaxID=146819 RepID=UPI0006283EAD